MEVMYPRCAGLDVHKETVVACVRIVEGGDVSRSVRTFATTTASLIELGEWLEVNGCTHVAMEATGVYWKPVWQVLVDSSLELVLANAAQVKNVPGRKSDVNDATWVSELLAHGLVRASFVPEPAIQQLRALLRTRKQLVREKASHVQRLQKTLEEANIKIESVLSDVMGCSGRAMIQALIDGESDPAKLAALAIGRCVRRQQPCAKRCMDALNVTIVFCLDCICSRSTRSMPPLPRSTGRPMLDLPAFAMLSNS